MKETAMLFRMQALRPEFVLLVALGAWMGGTRPTVGAEVTVLQLLDDFEGGPEGLTPPPGWEAMPVFCAAASFQIAAAEGGNHVAQLTYEFLPDQPLASVWLLSRARIRGRLAALHLRLRGDGSGNLLTATIRSPQGERRQVRSEPITWTEWKKVSLPLEGLSQEDRLETLMLEPGTQGHPRGTLLFDNLQAFVTVEEAQGLSVDVVTNRFTNVLAVGEPPRFSALVNNLTLAPTMTFRASFSTLEGQRFGEREQELEVDRRQPIRIPLPFEPPPWRPAGYFTLKVALTGQGGAEEATSTHLAVVYPPPNLPAATSALGCNLDFSLDRDRLWRASLDCALMGFAGIRWVRAEMAWPACEPQPQQFDWRTWSSLLDLTARYRLGVVAQVRQVPDWASEAPEGAHDRAWIPPRSPAAFENFLAAASAQWGNRVPFWEVWAGANSKQFWRPEADARRYADWLEASFRAVRRRAPQCQVGMGALVGPDLNFLSALLTGRDQNFFDFVALHIEPRKNYELWRSVYDGLWSVTDFLQKKKRYSPPWIAWTGEAATDDPVALCHQAASVVKCYTQVWPFGTKLFWKLFRDGPGEGHFGLFQADFTPKPSYVALCTLASILGSARFVEYLHLGAHFFGAYFETDKSKIIVLWAEPYSWELHLKLPGFGLYDFQFNPAAGQKDNLLHLRLGPFPVFLVGPTDPRPAVIEAVTAALKEKGVTVQVGLQIHPPSTDDCGGGPH